MLAPASSPANSPSGVIAASAPRLPGVRRTVCTLGGDRETAAGRASPDARNETERSREMSRMNQNPGGNAWPFCVLLLIATAATLSSVTAGAAAPTATPAAAVARTAECPGAPVQPAPVEAAAGEDMELDVTASTTSATMRRLYETAALGVVERAVTERAALRIVAFGASGVGATVLFQGSFAPVSADEVFNLAHRNRELCLARRALGSFGEIRPDPLGGSDLAGSLAAGTTALKEMVRPGGQMTLAQLTDGCQSPAVRGPNHALTNLCAELARGRSVGAILRVHPLEFRLPNARGVTIMQRGLGIGRNARFANSVFAQRLVGFWAEVCRRAHARTCVIGSGVL